MEKYKILEHKADLKIRAFGKSRKELFANLLFGMTDCQRPKIQNRGILRRRIKIKSFNPQSLLVDFLSEVLYLSQVNKEAYGEIEFHKLSPISIEGELIGRKVERFGEDIKAVTYHDLDIHQNPDQTWECTVLFDI